MSLRFAAALGLAAVAASSAALAQPAIPSRTPMAVIAVSPGKAVSRVETTRVDFAPGQAMPEHKHTVPVICFVTAGDFLTRIGDAPETRAPLGSVTYEPPQVVVHYFRNASATAPAQLTCASLAGSDDKVLNVMLDPKAR
ncbi:MAG TPA: cupin domain-containing protein [Phenylobacterium sp.]|jgi:quercetin dioxygenase-like cupin family protein|uniref:cupin domain-containing protein n=1 Tax=Phenylobacterium sp. TaxID=1871053 RepID=UPI002D11A246|nr:cupin domain-containing protein [Phenylobacterium sp.]HXA38014.1 cupin domain-containing protein [Phenylobacterium sp.]